jgi:hypothetical protein
LRAFATMPAERPNAANEDTSRAARCGRDRR